MKALFVVGVFAGGASSEVDVVGNSAVEVGESVERGEASEGIAATDVESLTATGFSNSADEHPTNAETTKAMATGIVVVRDGILHRRTNQVTVAVRAVTQLQGR